MKTSPFMFAGSAVCWFLAGLFCIIPALVIHNAIDGNAVTFFVLCMLSFLLAGIKGLNIVWWLLALPFAIIGEQCIWSILYYIVLGLFVIVPLLLAIGGKGGK